MKSHLKTIAALVVFFGVAPGVCIVGAKILLGQLPQEEQATTSWRRSRLLARSAAISPLFWSYSAQIEQEADIALNQHYLSEVISGADGSATPDDHLDFLDSRPTNQYWTAARAQLQFHYGAFDGLNTTPVVTENLRPVLSAALINDNKERMTQVATLLQSTDFVLPAGLAFYINTPLDSSHSAILLSAFLSPSDDPWTLIEQLPQTHHALALEAALGSEGVDALQIQQSAMALPDDTVGKSCLLLQLSKGNQNPDGVAEALELLSQSPQYPSRMTISRYGNCRPESFVPDEVLTSHQKQQLWLYQAQSWLAQYEIAKAQAAIKKAEALDIPESDLALNSKALHLRVLARELAGDLSGAEKYAKNGLVYDKAIFTHHLGRIAMLRNQKSEGLRLLSSIGYYPLPEPLKSEFDELLAIARRLGGSQAKLNIQGKEIGHSLFDDDERFRIWLIEHIDSVTLAPKPSIVLPMLNAWRGVDRHGEFMLKTQKINSISAESIVIRAQLRLLQAAIEGDDKAISSRWKDLSKARAWLAAIPHPAMLHLIPEAFVLEVH